MVTGLGKTAVIVVCWNNEALLEGCLQSVCAQTMESSMIVQIVVDNGSDDGSVALVRSRFPDAHIIEMGHNSGFSHANNVGIRHAFMDPLVDAVVLLNSDARFAPDWVAVLREFAATRPRGATFQALTLDHQDPTLVDSHHLYLSRSLHAMQFATGHRATDISAHTERVFGVNAAACLYTRAFLEAQPFDDYLDETMGMYLEDVDLATRALVMGWESWFVQGTRAYHMGSASAKKRASGFALRQTWRNQPVLLVSNLPWAVLGRGLWGLIGHEIGAVRHLRSSGQPELVGEIRRGRFEGFRLLPYALRRRRQLAPLRVVDADHLWELMRDGRAIR